MLHFLNKLENDSVMLFFCYSVTARVDVFTFLVMSRDEKSQLLLGIRRANRQPTNISSSVLSSDSMHIGILAAAAHAAANSSPFTVFYNPRLVTRWSVFTILACTVKFRCHRLASLVIFLDVVNFVSCFLQFFTFFLSMHAYHCSNF